MPIHSAGYRAWEGSRVPVLARWAAIASTGIRRTSKSKWLRRMMFLAVLPTLFLSAPFFVFEQAVRDPRMARRLSGILNGLPQTGVIADVVAANIAHATPEQVEALRHKTWSYLLLTLFRYPQATLMVLVIGIAAPPLIAHDIRSRAFLIYFSKPITRLEYVLGKMGTVTFFLAMITTLPAMLLYAAGVMLSPSPAVMLSTWDLPLRILLASVVLILPTTSMALMFSSMTTESRYAGFAWFAVWIFGMVTFSSVMAFTAGSVEGLVEPGWRTLVSPYHTLGVVQAWVFGLSTEQAAVAPSIALLALVTVASLTILFHRVTLPMRA